VKVGATNSYNAHRKYTIPAGVLKEGKNTIAIRVEDTVAAVEFTEKHQT
jgi:sialate O-acetylesterase